MIHGKSSKHWCHMVCKWKLARKERKQRRCRHRNRENPKAFPMHVPLPSVWHQFHKSYRRTLFRDNRIHGICPENPVPKALHFSVAPSLRSSPPAISTLPTQLSPSYFHVLDPQFFRTIALMEIVLKTPEPKALHFSVALSLRSSPPAISTSWTHSFSGQSQ